MKMEVEVVKMEVCLFVCFLFLFFFFLEMEFCFLNKEDVEKHFKRNINART